MFDSMQRLHSYTFVSSVFSRDSLPEVPGDNHSKSCHTILCKLRQKCATLNNLKKRNLISSCVFFLGTRQTELLPRCKDMPSLGEVLHSDGKLLTETILQVIQS